MKPNGPFRGLVYIALPALVFWLLVFAAIIWASDSDAAPCEHRSAAHIAEHGGLAADSAWHVAHGDLPTCGEASSTADRDTNRDNDNEGKSRYCRKHWIC